LNLTYPQVGGKFPTLLNGAEKSASSKKRSLSRRSMKTLLEAARSTNAITRRDLNATYGCQLFNEVFDNTLNYEPFSKFIVVVQ
jgi:hypothetical protein